MAWEQHTLHLQARARGFHIVTSEITRGLSSIAGYRVGLVNLSLQHTSASLCLNENADPDVRVDLEAWTREVARDNASYYVHTIEGPDDMPAHIKSAMFGTSLNIPIQNGRLALGTWQGIYLGEHRNHGGVRVVLATIQGEKTGERA